MVLDLAVALARAGVSGAVGASAAVADAGGREVVVASEEVQAVDLLQYESGRGPCVDALRTSQRQHVALETGMTRWPEFARAAMSEGFRSVLALPLRADGDTVGTLVLYSRTGFGAPEIEAAEVLARRAAIAVAAAAGLAGTQLANRNLQEGMATRGLIGQAQGILMARDRLDGTEAFAMLRRLSQGSNRRLRDVAAEIVSQHERVLRQHG